VHLGTPALLEFCRLRPADEALVLATIIGTEGSTYRKRGAMMLIARDGAYEGLVSGGCLEGDLLEHAARVFASGEPAHVTYDLSAGEDLVWNLGIGCDGVIHLLLQRLDPGTGLDLLRRLGEAHGARRAALLALVTRSGGGLSVGEVALRDSGGARAGSAALLQVLDGLAEDWPAWRSRTAERDSAELLLVQLPPPVRVLVCGAGPDAVPLAAALVALDWEVTVCDHRPAFARPERFPSACTVRQLRPEKLDEGLDPSALDAAVIMTHHLESDAEYLRRLCNRGLPYLGLLGPVARKQRLREMAGCDEVVLHGPAGLDIGAELPAAVALSIVAEIHAVLNDRDGRPLTELSP
jgi:xanthine/CO dehydrogenase XdhC/CoxF family maturation factor